MLVKVRWSWIRTADPPDPRWGWTGALYAIVAPSGHRIVYIGKAGYRTIRQRWVPSAKAPFWDWLERRGVCRHGILAGYVKLGPGRRLSTALLSDIESLLIHWVR